MKSVRDLCRCHLFWQRTAWVVLLAIVGSIPVFGRAQSHPQVTVWDTGSALKEAPDFANHAGWKSVPSDLVDLEADPSKAASDPGYYGREYAFAGDAIVENSILAAVFMSAQGRVVIYGKGPTASPDTPAAHSGHLDKKLLVFTPVPAGTPEPHIRRCRILRNADDVVALEVIFSRSGVEDASAVFVFDRTAIVEVRPAESLASIRLQGPLDYGIAPSFIGDDLIYRAADFSSADTLYLPVENVFVGLLPGEDSEFVMTWPTGKQQMRLRLGSAEQGTRLIDSVDFDPAGQSFYVAVLQAPTIWHEVKLAASWLEKDIALQWKRPFPAKWQTQLSEAGVRTTFSFRHSKGTIWRGVPGSYQYPVWFDGDRANIHLSKKLPPKGESVIYFLEGQNTPRSVLTPVDVVQATLGRPATETLLDYAGRKLRTHHRRGGEGVHRACTCGCTEAIQTVFEAGDEVEQRPYVAGALEDMTFFVQQHVERIEEYQRFASGVIAFLHSQADAAPDLKPFFENLEQIARQIHQEYDVQKPNMKTLAYAEELTGQTLALTRKKDPENLKAYMELLKAWRAMGGAQDYVLAQCHTITRKLAQETGYGCVGQPEAVKAAKIVREQCRRCLRNPDGYEIWADY